MGHYIASKIEEEGWGSKTVSLLEEYLKRNNPGLKGYSRRNIYNMVDFYNSYSSADFTKLLSKDLSHKKFVQSVVAQIQSNDNEVNGEVQSRIAQLQIPQILTWISWTAHVNILYYCQSIQEKLFYLIYAHRERLSVRELVRAIHTDAMKNILGGKQAQSLGMQQTYPSAGYIFKDKVFLDFLGLPEVHKEKQIQNGILNHIKDFILEMGRDFLFMGAEYPIEVGGKVFKIDLLFYHRGIRALCAIELKAQEFEPSFMGQLEFYLEALDRDVRRSDENPSVGILLCKKANQKVVEYAMNRSLSPTMITKYERELIPKDVLQRSLDEFMQFLDNVERK